VTAPAHDPPPDSPYERPAGPAGAPAEGRRLSRRDRQRAATTAEIIATARRLLVEQGPDGVTLRAIAREMGMTAPALYRYFSSHEELRAAVGEQLFEELVGCVAAAWAEIPESAAGEKPIQVVRSFRRWAVQHPREFELVFAQSASPAAGSGAPHSERFGAHFLALYQQWWTKHPFPVPPDADLDPALAGQLRAYQAEYAPGLPLGALQVFLAVWVRVYGLVALEVFGHLRFALDDVEPLFESMVTEMMTGVRTGTLR
jgi:AcrR family transcriptional regulator